jgi:hypothetical protein
MSGAGPGDGAAAESEEPVELASVPTAFMAELMVGALKDFGVDAVVFGADLADEFAVAQRVFGGTGGIRVMVPAGQLEAARAALAEIRALRPTDEELERAAEEAAPGPEDDDEGPVQPA